MKKIFAQILSVDKSENASHIIIRILGVKIKFQNPKMYIKFLRDHVTEQEKEQIANSPYWDALWYVQKYGHNFTRFEALDYWCKEGWRKGESPSKYINTEFCAPACGNINPIIAYESKRFIFFPDNKNNYKEDIDSQRIKDYIEYKQTRKAKSVVYTCITNDYDDLREIEIYKYIDKDWDYVCFSDNDEFIKQGQLGIWEVRPLQFTELDNTRNQRWHKLLPHLLFPEYEESIYIDTNINILTEYLFNLVKYSNSLFIFPKHFKNLCIYSEYQDVIKSNLDNQNLINDELTLIIEEGMPINYGFGENNVLYRKHNNSEIIEIMEEWWDMVSTYSKRDQLSLAYLLWKHNVKIEDCAFENTRHQIDNFYVFGHKKGRS